MSPHCVTRSSCVLMSSNTLRGRTASSARSHVRSTRWHWRSAQHLTALTAGPNHLGPPSNGAHVREWTALELLAFLRSTGFAHGVITWTPAHDLAVRATSVTAFLSNTPERLTVLGLAGDSIAGFVVAPPRIPKVVARATGLAADIRRHGRRAQLRLLGLRRGI